ncbi:MAG: hypothetical protein AB1726_13535 [Planctomycetota bacterium]
MRIPRYWHQERSTERIGEREFVLSRWGWSETSVEEARRRAAERLAATVLALRKGEVRDAYDYLADPLREELLDVVGPREAPRAVVTRNGYGARVLNSARAFFADVDVRRPGLLARLFRGARVEKEKALAGVEAFVARNAGAGFRIYESPAGLRLLATDRLRDPGRGESDALLASLGADPLYRRLCRAQLCYRARLTAKPWRIGIDRPPVRFPQEHTREPHARWCAAYDAAAARFAACRFLRQIGRDAGVPEIAEITALHDAASGAGTDRPLA